MWTENIWCIFREKLSFSNSSDVYWTENIWCVFRVKLPFLNSSGAVWTVKLPFSNSFGVAWTGQRLFHHPITMQMNSHTQILVPLLAASLTASHIPSYGHTVTLVSLLSLVLSKPRWLDTALSSLATSINKLKAGRGGKDGIAKLEWNRAYLTYKKVLDLLLWTFNFWTLFISFWANFKQTFRTTCWNIARVSLRLQSMNWTEKSVK